MLIVVHELSHVAAAFYLKEDIEEVIIYPFGGVTKINALLNSSIKKEIFILIMGPIGQMLFYFMIFILYKYNLVNSSTFNNLTYLNFFLLIFNLLPILPLDGGRLLNNVLNFKFSFKNSHIITIFGSCFVLVLLLLFLLFSVKIFYVIVLLLLIKSIFYEIKIHKIMFNKFVIERILYNFKFKKGEDLKNINGLKRNKIHNFIVNNKIYNEREYILKYYLKN